MSENTQTKPGLLLSILKTNLFLLLQSAAMWSRSSPRAPSQLPPQHLPHPPHLHQEEHAHRRRHRPDNQRRHHQGGGSVKRAAAVCARTGTLQPAIPSCQIIVNTATQSRTLWSPAAGTKLPFSPVVIRTSNLSAAATDPGRFRRTPHFRHVLPPALNQNVSCVSEKLVDVW